jgi:NADPH:quinone reductase-like Zn-dependent oxidoreductase
VSQELHRLFADVTREDLTFLAELMSSGKLTSVIDRRYPLRELPEAIRYLEEGHARGKVVILPDETLVPGDAQPTAAEAG